MTSSSSERDRHRAATTNVCPLRAAEALARSLVRLVAGLLGMVGSLVGLLEDRLGLCLGVVAAHRLLLRQQIRTAFDPGLIG